MRISDWSSDVCSSDLGGTGSCRVVVVTMVHRLGLGNEVARRAGHAVIIGPAMDDRQARAPIAVRGRRVRRLPFERGGAPRIGISLGAFEQAPDQDRKSVV